MCSSADTSEDTIVYITPQQLKTTNLIFVEHDYLLKENNLLNQQVKNYQIKNDMLLQTDSIRLNQINYINDMYTSQVNDLNNVIKKKNHVIKGWQIGGITVTVGLILFLIFK